MDARPELRLLGGTTLLSPDGRPVTGAAAQSRRLAVLAVLAEAWPAPVTRDRVIGLLWPEQDEAGARRLLTQALYELRRELGPVVGGSARDLALDPDALRVDLVDVRRALRDDDLEGAVARYGGPLLDGFHLRGSAEFERWLEGAREAARRDVQRALEVLAARDEAAGRMPDAARWAARIVQLAPFDAGAVTRAVRLLDLAGDHGAALAAAAAYERRMREELEVEPAAEVLAHAESIRARPAPASPASPASPARVVPPSPPRAAAPVRTPQRFVWAGALVLLATLGVVVALKVRDGRAPSPAAERRLALRPFRAAAGDSAGARIAHEVTALLAASLRGVDGVRVVTAADSGRLPAPGDLRGDVTLAGGQLRLDAELRTGAAGEPPVLVTVTGARDSVLALADRLAAGLLPPLYPGAAGARAPGPWASAATLRHFLNGEAALRRGDDDAALASFTTVTELQPDLGFPWYRRALAAEQAHRSDDADRSSLAADARAATLAPRERQLVHGYARWRAGDAVGAEAIFRELLRADSRDRDAWWHLAEIAYHAGPLHGRGVDDARDPWRQVVALDSGNYSALLHAVRLEARAGDSAAVHALLRRAPLADSPAPSARESRVIAAYADGSPAAIAAARGDLEALPDYSLGFVQGVVAGLLERPESAEPMARRLTRAEAPQAVQGEGHLALAHLALARGRWRDAMREVQRAERHSPVAAAWARAYFATLPWLEAPPTIRGEARARLVAAPLTDAAAPMSLQLAVDAPAARMIDGYLHGLLRLADSTPPRGDVPRLGCDARHDVAPSTAALCDDLERGLRAEALRRRGEVAASLRELESLGMIVPYQYAARSMFFARSRERYLRAAMLERAGRLREADAWYASAPHGSWMDYVYLAPTHLRRGQIRERLGDPAGAADHYRRALALWDAPDPELASLRHEAEEGLRRTAGRAGWE